MPGERVGVSDEGAGVGERAGPIELRRVSWRDE